MTRIGLRIGQKSNKGQGWMDGAKGFFMADKLERRKNLGLRIGESNSWRRLLKHLLKVEESDYK